MKTSRERVIDELNDERGKHFKNTSAVGGVFGLMALTFIIVMLKKYEHVIDKGGEFLAAYFGLVAFIVACLFLGYWLLIGRKK